jgi:YhcH/YjgK/YiaL family protein
MIADSLDRSELYASIHPLFNPAFEYLRAFKPSTPDGRHEVMGERLFSLPQSYETFPASERKFEAHERYIDIQYIYSGEEVIEHVDVGLLRPDGDFDSERDVGFYLDPAKSTPVVLRAGDFAIFFPHDAHKPCVTAGQVSAVRKVVMKVAMAE